MPPNRFESISNLPSCFRDEYKQLQNSDINTWKDLYQIKDSELNSLALKGLATERNLKRLKGMATLICELSLPPSEAALLMHSGLATVKSIAVSTPQEIITKTGRLNRNLKSDLKSDIDFAKANSIIKLAMHRQLKN